MRPPPIPLVRAGPSHGDSLLGLLTLASRICRLAADIDKIDGVARQARVVGSTRDRPSALSHTGSTISATLCDFLCPSAASSSSSPSARRPASFPSSHARLRRIPSDHHRQGILAHGSARSYPSTLFVPSRSASTTTAAATESTDSHLDSDSPYVSPLAADLPWQHPPDASVQSVTASDNASARPGHWLSDWQGLQDDNPNDASPNKLIEQAIANHSTEFIKSRQTEGGPNGLDLRREAGHRLWYLYLQHAHKESLSLLARVSLARELADLATKVTTNKVSSYSSKTLRCLVGRRIHAIFEDCHILLSKLQSKDPSSVRAILAYNHTDFGLALLQPIALALQAQPIAALNLLDDVLLRSRPDIYQHKTDHHLPAQYVYPINAALLTIFDSINFELNCRGDAEDVAQRIRSHPEFFRDTDLLADLRDGQIQLNEPSSPIVDSLAWFAASPHAFLLSHPAFRSARGAFLHSLSQASDPHGVLSHLGNDRDPQEPGFAQACEFLLRSVLLHRGSEASLELYDNLWSRGVPMSSRLIHRLIRGSSGQGPSARLETLFHRLSHAKSDTHRFVSNDVLRTVTLSWAMRNRADRVDFFLARLQRRKAKDLEHFVRSAMIELAAARGEVQTLYEKLAETYDFEARDADKCAPGKTPLDGKAYGLLIKSCNRSDDADLAEFYLTEALERGIVPRSSDFNLLIDLHVRQSNIDAALAIFDQMREFGVQPDKYTYTILIHGFTLRRDPDSAAHALRAMIAAGKTPDRITYAALLNCFVEAGLYDAAIRLFDWMRKHSDFRLRPTIEVCNIILKAYVLSSLPVQKVMQFVDKVGKMGLRPNANTYALMLQSACDAGLMDVAEEVFSEAESVLPNVTGAGPGQGANLYHFTIMIHGYLRLGDHTEAREYFDEMQHRKLSPSAVTWSVMVHSYAHSENEANYDLACTLVSQLVADETKKTFRPSSWNVAEQPEKAQASSASRISAKHSPSFDTLYTVLMVAQARRGEPEKVEKTLKAMARASPGLSVPAMTPLLDAYRRAGDVDSALRLFDQIYAAALETASSKSHRVYAYNPSKTSAEAANAAESAALTQRRKDASSRNVLCLPVSIMIDLLSTAGRHEEIAKIWARAKNDGFGFDSDNWNHLAASMARAGQLEEALSVVEHVLYRNPPNVWMRARVRENERNAGKADTAGEGEVGNVAAPLDEGGNTEASESKDTSNEDEAFDPLPSDAPLDPAAAYRADAASSPSLPPNRRHQGRTDDDPYVELPFDHSEREILEEEEELNGEVLRSIIDEADEGDYVEPTAFYLDGQSGISLTGDLNNTEDRFSPWYAHFETMEAISRGLADVRDAHKAITLLDRYRTAAGLLDLHERKVEIIRERQREEAVRSARDLIDGRA